MWLIPAASGGLKFVPNAKLLQPAEIEAVVRAAAAVGFRKMRLTGGEPTLRHDLIEIIERVKAVLSIEEIVLTTNGYRLTGLAKPMAGAGLNRLNIHLDALNQQQLVKTMRLAKPEKVWEGITAAEEAGLLPIKLNAVVTRHFNESDVPCLAELTLNRPWHVYFIELMPLGALAGIALDNFVSTAETISLIEARFGPIYPLNGVALDGEARLYKIPGAQGTLGFISPVSNPYCGDCNRLRLTADGRIRLCLLSDQEINFRDTLRGGGAHKDLVALFQKAVTHKPWGYKLKEGIHPQARTMSQIGGQKRKYASFCICPLHRSHSQGTGFVGECLHIFGQTGEDKYLQVLGPQAIGYQLATHLAGLSQQANKQANTRTVDVFNLTKIEAYDFRISTFCFFVSRIQWMLISGVKVAPKVNSRQARLITHLSLKMLPCHRSFPLSSLKFCSHSPFPGFSP